MSEASGAPYRAVRLPDGIDFVMRPVMRGMCRYESVVDGTIGLEDVALMNDAIAAQDENAYRAQEAGRQK